MHVQRMCRDCGHEFLPCLGADAKDIQIGQRIDAAIHHRRAAFNSLSMGDVVVRLGFEMFRQTAHDEVGEVRETAPFAEHSKPTASQRRVCRDIERCFHCVAVDRLQLFHRDTARPVDHDVLRKRQPAAVALEFYFDRSASRSAVGKDRIEPALLVLRSHRLSASGR